MNIFPNNKLIISHFTILCSVNVINKHTEATDNTVDLYKHFHAPYYH